MSSISGVSSSNSIYGNRNVITGLASGMDTESMIENVISSYKNKITALQQKRTKTEWKQEAYRSIINKMSAFAEKYTSYRSANNLMSASFFDQAVKTVAKGENASKVSATGRSSSDVQIDRVLQLATAASYKLSGSALDAGTSAFGGDKVSASASGTLDLDANMKVGSLNGSVTLAYGGSSSLSYLSVDFDETKIYNSAQELVDDINKQLSEQSISIGTKTYTGKDLLNNVIQAELSEDGKSITFTDPKKNGVYVSDASGSAKQLLLGGQETSTVAEKQIHALTIGSSTLNKQTMSTYKYLMSRGSSLEITLDGKTKTVNAPNYTQFTNKLDELGKKAGISKEDLEKYEDVLAGDKNTDLSEDSLKKLNELRDQAYTAAFQDNVDGAFGKGKLTVSDANTAGNDGIKFKFEAAKGSTFSINSARGETLGFGESERVTSYLNTGKTLGDLLGANGKEAFEKLGFTAAQENVYDSAGNKIGTTDKVDAEGSTLYSFMVNGKEIGQFNEKSTLSDVINAMNSNSDCGVKVGYSKLTNELTFTAKDTGAASRIDFTDPENEKSLAAALFGVPGAYNDKGTYTKGQDAIFEATVNGTSLGQLTRSSNSVDMDGMTVNLKGTFGYKDYKDSYEVKINGMNFKASDADGPDGKLKFTNSNGTSVNYTTTASSGDILKYQNQEIYGKYENGKLNFYVDSQDGKETMQVYARTGTGGKGVWFSINDGVSDKTNAPIDVTKNVPTAEKDETEAVSFETSSDADKIVDVVKQMVEDYNAMATEIKNAYSTLPAQRSNKAYYEPLTDEDREDMSESAAEAWDEKAKQGILFGDRDLATLYQRLTSAVSMTGENGAALRAAGITVNYSNGLSTLEFNETKFRDALSNDPDKVRDAFTASTDSGAKSNGLMQALKQPLDIYGKTIGGKGVLVDKAGSPLAPSTMYNNIIQTELNNIDEQIEKWQDKMSDQVDYYTNQFSRLEQLIQQMNSQSSYFSQLMGG